MRRRGTIVLRVLGVVGVVFGVATLVAAGTAIFGTGGDREEVVVPFVVGFNGLAGFAYVLAGVGMLLTRRWAVRLAAVIAGVTLLVFAALGVHVALGGAFAGRTVVAMTVRAVAWVAFALIGRRALACRGEAGPVT